MRCPRCDTEVSQHRLACPACRQLLHSDELKRLAAEAGGAVERSDLRAAVELWRRVLELLPPGSRQHDEVEERIERLEKQRVVGDLPGTQAAEDAPIGPGISWKKLGVGAGALGLLLWKLKAVLAFALTKGKLLLFGASKGGMLWGALASFGVYWAAWGWKFALGLMVSLYIHELGHVFALKRRGIPASAPMFVPGLGAYVRLKRRPPTPVDDARVGLAGPVWGLAAALAAYVGFITIGWSSLGAIARFGAWINLFNLLPVWQLDGSRGFAALNRVQRVLAVVVVAAVFMLTSEGLLVLVGLVGLYRVVVFDGPEEGDWTTLTYWTVLVVVLGWLAQIDVPV